MLAFIVGASLTFVSCEKDAPEQEQPVQDDQNPDDEDPDDQKPDENPDDQNPDDQQPEEPTSRTFSVTGTIAEGTPFVWADLDLTKLGLVTLDAASTVANATPIAPSAADGSLTFNAELPLEVTEGYAYYPAATLSAYSAEFAFGPAYTQSAAGKMDNLKAVSEKMTFGEATVPGTEDEVQTTAAEETAPVEVSTSFKMLGHLLKLNVFDSKGKPDPVTSVTFTASEGANIAGTYTYDFTDPAKSAAAGSANSVTVTLTTPAPMDAATSKEAAAVVYVPVLPASSEGYTCTIATQGGESYVFTSEDAADWTAENAMTEYDFDLATKRVPEYVIFEFANKGIVKPNYTLAPEGGDNPALTDYYIVAHSEDREALETASATATFGDMELPLDYTIPYYWDFDYVVEDTEGNPVTWVELRSADNNNKFACTWEANDTGAQRVAKVYVYFNDQYGDYVTIGTYNTTGTAYTAIEDPAETPIQTFTFTQEAQAQ